MAHALVHAPDHDNIRRAGRERDVAEGGEPEREGDRHGGEHHRPDQADEEDQQVEISQGPQHGRKQDKHADYGHDERHTAGYVPPVTDARQPQQRDEQHKSDANRQRRRAPRVDDLERRGGDIDLVGGELVGRVDDEQQKGQGCGDRDHIEECPCTWLQHPDDGRHAHVLAALEGDDRSPAWRATGTGCRPARPTTRSVCGRRSAPGCPRAEPRFRRRPGAPPGSQRAEQGPR